MHTTSLITEIRRRLFSHVYIVDKVFALYANRPPLLSRRYCSLLLPLDISDEVVMALSGQAISIEDIRAANGLDDQGWTTGNVIQKSTIMRARVLVGHVRDEIIEVMLGVGEDLDIGRLK